LKVISKSKGSDYLAEVWTRQRVEEALLLMQDVISLNTPINTDERGDETELEFLIEDTSPSPEEIAVAEETKEHLIQYMQEFLKPRDIEIMKMRYGFDTEHPMTLEEVGQHFGMTRERVRQIEQRALRRLRIMFLHKNITQEDI
jgi:RNA polymerase primary sigma factor